MSMEPLHGRDLRAVFRAHKRRILLTYGLFNVENLLRLARPSTLGLAVDRLLRGDPTGLFAFLGVHFAFIVVGSARQAYDTRVFSRIYGQVAGSLVMAQRGHGVDVSRVAARSALSREVVDFFEHDVTNAMDATYSVIGAMIMMSLYDTALTLLSVLLFVPALICTIFYGRVTRRYNACLNDRIEQEVGVIEKASPAGVREHYGHVAKWWVRLSDLQVLNFGLMEVFVMALMSFALIRFCAKPGIQPGEILASFQYVMMFVSGVDHLPMLVRQFGRLRDIVSRLHDGRADAPAPAGAVAEDLPGVTRFEVTGK